MLVILPMWQTLTWSRFLVSRTIITRTLTWTTSVTSWGSSAWATSPPSPPSQPPELRGAREAAGKQRTTAPPGSSPDRWRDNNHPYKHQMLAQTSQTFFRTVNKSMICSVDTAPTSTIIKRYSAHLYQPLWYCLWILKCLNLKFKCKIIVAQYYCIVNITYHIHLQLYI